MLSAGIPGWPLALTRLGATLVLSLAAGYATLALSRISLLPQVSPGSQPVSPLEEAESCYALAPAKMHIP